MLLKVLATGHSTDIYFIQCTSPFNYIPVGGGIPPWEVEVFDGLWKLVSLYTNHAFPPQSIIFRKPKITDTFRDPILVTETNWHITPWTLQVLSSWTILEPVAALMSVRALAQAEVLTNHKKSHNNSNYKVSRGKLSTITIQVRVTNIQQKSSNAVQEDKDCKSDIELRRRGVISNKDTIFPIYTTDISTLRCLKWCFIQPIKKKGQTNLWTTWTLLTETHRQNI